jgi:hypothetical protein
VSLAPDLRSLLYTAEQLDENNRKLALALIKALKTHEDEQKSGGGF